MNAIEVNNLSFKYPDKTEALRNINLEIKRGSKVAILGANGSGKSTLLQHLNGLTLAQTGEVKIFSKTISKQNVDQIRQEVGILFDNPDNQLFSTTVYNDIAFGPSNMRLTKEEQTNRVVEAIKKVKIEHLKDKSPCNLSLGQKKKVAIAGVLAMNPSILLMDEPFSGLDPTSLIQFIDILNDLSKEGCTQVISTHDVDIAYKWADYIIIIHNGNLVASGGIDILEDEVLMEKSMLARPIMAEIFAGTKYSPKTGKEGNKILMMKGVI